MSHDQSISIGGGGGGEVCAVGSPLPIHGKKADSLPGGGGSVQRVTPSADAPALVYRSEISSRDETSSLHEAP